MQNKDLLLMVDQSTIDALIQSTSEMLARSGDGDKHTVAASVYASDGMIYSGVNVFHFTGGLCAEIVALARLISDSGTKPLAIIAVADSGRGAVAPCGRCRQVLADYCPEMQVILDVDGVLEARPLTELLPFGYKRAERPAVSCGV